MSLFIAIVDDDPADRKQSERLLSRERDVRVKNKEVIYFDTYGSKEALIPYCSKYDLFLIDISHSTQDGMMVAVDLKHRGAKGRMVLASSSIDYKAKYGDHEDFIFIEKPLYQKDIKKLVEIAYEHKEKETPRLELRGEKETIYVTKHEILYLKEAGYYTIVALTDDRTFHMSDGLDKIAYSLTSDYFIYTDRNTIINMEHVVSRENNRFKMADGAVIKFGILNKSKIIKAWEAFALKA
ncbi:MAG: LytTR family transcriptional regulator DNA-binding domain-containing protein [Lachnospiraceae bacterium]|nr:LytTR family transcriptional regulator DNA-binding domain-containing protein [Lachnospiraceae bacterium]